MRQAAAEASIREAQERDAKLAAAVAAAAAARLRETSAKEASARVRAQKKPRDAATALLRGGPTRNSSRNCAPRRKRPNKRAAEWRGGDGARRLAAAAGGGITKGAERGARARGWRGGARRNLS